MQNTQTILSVYNLKKYFPLPKKHFLSREKRFLRANDDVNLSIRRGETFALVGESGSGKSTLGRAILQLEKPTAGKVFYQGVEGEVELTACKEGKLRPLRRRLQMIFQDPYSSLNPRMTVGQIIGEGVWAHGIYKRNSTALKEYVVGVMEACGLQSHLINRYPHEFSGGQRQRICIARALALEPEFVVCDECVSALDVSVQAQILNLLADLKEKRMLTYLFISHDLSVVRHISDRIAVMYLGRIVEMGETESVFTGPFHPYTMTLLSAIPTLDNKGKRKFVQEKGSASLLSPPTGCPFHTRCFMAREECLQEVRLEQISTGHFSACRFAKDLVKK